MADVFVSYSRKDTAFVRELHDFLTGSGKDVWVDWDDIPPGSHWEHRRTDGSGVVDVTGTVVELVPPERLVMTFGPPSQVAFDIEPYGEIVRLTVTHENLATEDDYEAVSVGWPAVLANLKSLLETGHVLPQSPWEMHAALRDAQMAVNDPR